MMRNPGRLEICTGNEFLPMKENCKDEIGLKVEKAQKLRKPTLFLERIWAN